ncbi:helix-turn-helix domain-containing protein [Weissella cibaria]|uniref:helix-turn-helix domain-containing protein n=1 Tax=Weissella cibaria TaxID=137591 RepID=UPI0007069CCB|nr:helix-turn-helix transcriptional regulator [Weissella cibaria]ALI33135.1 hypothetical protein AO080_06595 [Weissella cibaria]MCG4286702.1 helix-turn-helix domain-containing protein [Weissella cibaria]
MTVFERIKEISKKRGLNLKKTAIAAGLSENAIYKWKSQTPQSNALQAVADVLGVSVDYLLGNSGNMHPSDKTDEREGDLKDYFEKHPILQYDGNPIPEAELKIIRRILEDMDD